MWLLATHIWRYLLDVPEGGGIHGVMDHRRGEEGSSTWWKIYNKQNKNFSFDAISKWPSNTEKTCKLDRLTKMHSLSPCYVGTKMCNKSCGFLQFINFCTGPWSVVCSCGTFVVAKFHIGFHFSFVSAAAPAHNAALSHQAWAGPKKAAMKNVRLDLSGNICVFGVISIFRLQWMIFMLNLTFLHIAEIFCAES